MVQDLDGYDRPPHVTHERLTDLYRTAMVLEYEFWGQQPNLPRPIKEVRVETASGSSFTLSNPSASSDRALTLKLSREFVDLQPDGSNWVYARNGVLGEEDGEENGAIPSRSTTVSVSCSHAGQVAAESVEFIGLIASAYGWEAGTAECYCGAGVEGKTLAVDQIAVEKFLVALSDSVVGVGAR